ncbi:MAG: NERD domain-containing protein [Acidimicrobiales bacterium]|nr:NERD domain-containing protein [Acidimicrobiales bacterium]
MAVTALRARATCTACSSRLPPRTDVWWDEETRSAWCLTCARVEGLLDAAGPSLDDFATPTAPTSETASGDATQTPAVQGQAPPGQAVAEAIAPEPTASEAVSSEPVPSEQVPSEQVPSEQVPSEPAASGVQPDPLGATGPAAPIQPRGEEAPALGEAAEPSGPPPTQPTAERSTLPGNRVVPPLPPRDPVTPLRPARTMGTAAAALRRFPSEGATAKEPATDDLGEDKPTEVAAKLPPLRRADPLPKVDGEDDSTANEAHPRDTTVDGAADHKGAGPEPQYVQSAAELIGRLRSVRNSTVRSDRRVPLVVERPEQSVDRGVIDDTRVTQTLEAARIHGVEVLHHRGLGVGVEIEHLVVAVNGVWVVVEQETLTGPLEKRDLGDWFTADARLFVGEQDRTDLVVEARTQADAVRTVLAETVFSTVPVRPVVCFGNVPPAWVRDPFVVGGVSVTWRNHLVEPMLDPVLIDRDGRHRLVELLVGGAG